MDAELTERQRQVLEARIADEPYKTIAARLSITESTARAHLTFAIRALGVRTRKRGRGFVVARRLWQDRVADQALRAATD